MQTNQLPLNLPATRVRAQATIGAENLDENSSAKSTKLSAWLNVHADKPPCSGYWMLNLAELLVPMQNIVWYNKDRDEWSSAVPKATYATGALSPHALWCGLAAPHPQGYNYFVPNTEKTLYSVSAYRRGREASSNESELLFAPRLRRRVRAL